MLLKCMDTLSGDVTLSFTYLLPFSKGFTLKGKNLLLLEQILSSKSKLQTGMAMSVREANMKSQKLFPFVKMEVYPYTLMPFHLHGNDILSCKKSMLNQH